MKRNKKRIWLFLFLFFFAAQCSIVSFADWDRETKWSYYDENGEAVRDQWIEGEKGERYYINEDGWMVTGWHQAKDGGTYFFDSSGVAVIGLAEIDGRLYYFEKDGKMFFGDQEVAGKTYHFTPKGIIGKGEEVPLHPFYTGEGRRVEQGGKIVKNTIYSFGYLPFACLFLYGIFLVVRIGMQSEEDAKREEQLRIVISSGNVLAVSGLVSIYGLFDEMFFNKALCSVAVFVISMELSGKMLKTVRMDKRTAFASFFLSVLLVLAEVVGMGLRIYDKVQESPYASEFLWMILSALPLSCLAEPFFFSLFGMVKRGEDQACKEEVNTVFWKSWLAVFAGYIPCYLAFFPGIYGYDMSWQWQMYINHDYNTHHPILHTALSGWLLETGKKVFGSYNGGLAVYALLQLLIFSGCIAFGLRFLYKLQVSRKLRFLVMGFYILFPLFPILGISTTKDVIFAGLFLVVFVGICDMVNNRKLYKGRQLAGFVLLTVLMGLFRNNALYGLLFLAVCLLALAMVRRHHRNEIRLNGRMAALMLISVVGIQAMFFVLQVGFHAKKGSVVEMMSIPFQQMARTYLCHKDEFREEDRSLLVQYVPEYAMESYTYHISDPVKGAVNNKILMDYKTDFVKLWLRLGLQFPKEYMLAAMYNTFGIWYLGEDFSCLIVTEMSPPFDGEHVVETHSLMPSLKSVYSWFTSFNLKKNLPLLSIPFFTPFYVWVVFICMMIVVVKKQYIYLSPSLYLMGYILTLALGPCMMIRYMLPVIVCVPVLVMVVFLGMREEGGK